MGTALNQTARFDTFFPYFEIILLAPIPDLSYF